MCVCVPVVLPWFGGNNVWHKQSQADTPATVFRKKFFTRAAFERILWARKGKTLSVMQVCNRQYDRYSSGSRCLPASYMRQALQPEQVRKTSTVSKGQWQREHANMNGTSFLFNP